MVKWLLIAVMGLLWCGCVIHPDPSKEPRTTNESGETHPPPDIEKSGPPKRPATTCPPAMRGSC